ncbi:MAG: imidazoleglycerol-phosphate dehydratase HisB [Thermodesulfobacteriota bacterium]
MRTAQIARKTTETDISVSLCLDGTGKADIRTGIGFFDHMLHHLTRHGLLDMEISATGDLHVDFHHTVEDVGICVGEALGKALSDKAGIRRYGQATVPMDEALASVALDLSGRPYLVYHNPLHDRMTGEFALDLVPVFMQGFADRAGVTLHATVHRAENPHHAAEAIFKAVGRALRDAVEPDPRVQGVPSTKGVLD